MKVFIAAAVLSLAGATAASAAVIQFNQFNGFGPQASTGAFPGLPASPKRKGPKIRALGSSIGGGAIGMFIAPPKPVRPATGGPGNVVAGPVSGPLVAPLPGGMALMLAGLGVFAVGAGMRRRRVLS